MFLRLKNYLFCQKIKKQDEVLEKTNAYRTCFEG